MGADALALAVGSELQPKARRLRSSAYHFPVPVLEGRTGASGLPRARNSVSASRMRIDRLDDPLLKLLARGDVPDAVHQDRERVPAIVLGVDETAQCADA